MLGTKHRSRRPVHSSPDTNWRGATVVQGLFASPWFSYVPRVQPPQAKKTHIHSHSLTQHQCFWKWNGTSTIITLQNDSCLHSVCPVWSCVTKDFSMTAMCSHGRYDMGWCWGRHRTAWSLRTHPSWSPIWIKHDNSIQFTGPKFITQNRYQSNTVCWPRSLADIGDWSPQCSKQYQRTS